VFFIISISHFVSSADVKIDSYILKTICVL